MGKNNDNSEFRPDGSLPTGKTLIAAPSLHDPHFYKSVVMILDSDPKEGYLGLVLNKPMSLTLADLIPDWKEGRDIPVYAGGPVEPSRLFMLHTLGDVFRGSKEIASGIYVGGRLDDISRYLQEHGLEEGSLRFFLGYSGWVAGQLEEEVLQGSWAVHDFPEASTVLWGEGDAYWRREVSSLDSEEKNWLLMPGPEQLN